jgi:hypothetical protein
MWSCPFNFDYYKNWLGVGLTEYGTQTHRASWFDQMYYKGSGNGLNFVRGEYYYHKDEVVSTSKMSIIYVLMLRSSTQ